MRRSIALIVFLVSVAYLTRDYVRAHRQPEPPPPPPTVLEKAEPIPIFSKQELDRVRQSLRDSDPEVRWAAVQLLFNVRDPQIAALSEKLMAEDPDADLRIKIVGLMKGREDMLRIDGLIKGLSDIDKSVRIASLAAIGEIGDPSVTTWVIALLKDPEPDVRVAALQTLGRFQDKRKAEFHLLAEKLRNDYEESLRRAAARR